MLLFVPFSTNTMLFKPILAQSHFHKEKPGKMVLHLSFKSSRLKKMKPIMSKAVGVWKIFREKVYIFVLYCHVLCIYFWQTKYYIQLTQSHWLLKIKFFVLPVVWCTKLLLLSLNNYFKFFNPKNADPVVNNRETAVPLLPLSIFLTYTGLNLFQRTGPIWASTPFQ